MASADTSPNETLCHLRGRVDVARDLTRRVLSAYLQGPDAPDDLSVLLAQAAQTLSAVAESMEQKLRSGRFVSVAPIPASPTARIGSPGPER